MSGRTTIVLDEEVVKKLRSLQANKIKDTRLHAN